MNINPKTWSKSQQIITIICVATILIGISIYSGILISNHYIHERKEMSTKQIEETLEHNRSKKDISYKAIDNLIEKATKNPTIDNIKAASEYVEKITDIETKASYETIIKGLENRLEIIEKAQNAVKDYRSHVNDQTKKEEAQKALDSLKDKNDENLKKDLQKSFDESNKQAQSNMS